MPSTRRQNAKARMSRDVDMMSDYENMDILFGNQHINSIERDLAKTIDSSIGNNDIEAFSQ